MSRPSSTTPSNLPLVQPNLQFVPPRLRKTDTETSDDILAQINGGAPVDNSSYYPPPASPTRSTLVIPVARFQPRQKKQSALDDDDIFGVFATQSSTTSTVDKARSPEPSTVENDDFDILGNLSKPVQQSYTELDNSKELPSTRGDSKYPAFSETSSDSSDDEQLRRAKKESRMYERERQSDVKQESRRDPRAPFVQQLVEMGFTKEQASAALSQTESGTDVAEAAELLLSLQIEPTSQSARETIPQPVPAGRNNVGTITSHAQKQVGGLNESGDWVDSTFDIATKTLASANSWFTNKSAMARRKLAEYNASQAAATHESRFDERPKWLRDAEKYERKEKGKSKAKEDEDDALREEGLPMHPAERKRLEMNGVLPPSSPNTRRGSVDSGKSGKSISGSIRSIPDSVRTIGTNINGQYVVKNTKIPQQFEDSRRFKANDDEAASYVSSRRRKPQAALQSSAILEADPPRASASEKGKGKQRVVEEEEEEEDLFGVPSPRVDKGKGKARAPASSARDEDETYGTTRILAADKGKAKASISGEVDLFSPARSATAARTSPARASRPVSQKIYAPTRQLPYLDATILASSSQNRSRGSEAFKRGDFAKALTFYDSALLNLPSAHPIRVLSLTNRAITQIQLGASKAAADDCDEALNIIGPQNGVNESIDDAGKQIPMTSLWCKAMTRKATALEMQEKNQDALGVWQDLVKSGLGGPQAIEARQRCEKLAKPKQKSAPAKPTGSSSQKPSQASRVAVQKLRAENDKAVQVEAQRDALYDTVDTRIASWSAGKEQNIRALLSSLDQVLWPTSGWKKVTLADLVINSKVKVIYMKALAKVHPDKISRDASVEEKMIAASVFSKLNGAWDAFKATNNM